MWVSLENETMENLLYTEPEDWLWMKWVAPFLMSRS
jgi:hypothetical protein